MMIRPSTDVGRSPALRGARLTVYWAAFGAVLIAPGAPADVVETSDGSRLIGTIEHVWEGKLVLTTDALGRVELDMAKITAIGSDRRLSIQLVSGDKLVGPIEIEGPPDARVCRVTTAVGDVSVTMPKIVMVWTAGTESPEIVSIRNEAAAAQEALKPKWSATVEAGGRMKEGNTDSLVLNGGAAARRKGPNDLLLFYARVAYEEENDRRTDNEYIAGARYEQNLNERWFWYVRGELEYDEFEDLDLRTTVAGGPGYVWIDRGGHELKTRTGVGYRHETFGSGQTGDDFVGDFALDYRVDITPWLLFTHAAVFTPSFEEFQKYRLEFDTALSFPLKQDQWKLKLGMRNDYNSRPKSGGERLDNEYYANIAVDLTW